jgi:hypothetical protein
VFVLLEGEGQAQTSIEWGDFAVGAQSTNETDTIFINIDAFMARNLMLRVSWAYMLGSFLTI